MPKKGENVMGILTDLHRTDQIPTLDVGAAKIYLSFTHDFAPRFGLRVAPEYRDVNEMVDRIRIFLRAFSRCPKWVHLAIRKYRRDRGNLLMLVKRRYVSRHQLFEAVIANWKIEEERWREEIEKTMQLESSKKVGKYRRLMERYNELNVSDEEKLRVVKELYFLEHAAFRRRERTHNAKLKRTKERYKKLRISLEEAEQTRKPVKPPEPQPPADDFEEPTLARLIPVLPAPEASPTVSIVESEEEINRRRIELLKVGESLRMLLTKVFLFVFTPETVPLSKLMIARRELFPSSCVSFDSTSGHLTIDRPGLQEEDEGPMLDQSMEEPEIGFHLGIGGADGGDDDMAEVERLCLSAPTSPTLLSASNCPTSLLFQPLPGSASLARSDTSNGEVIDGSIPASLAKDSTIKKKTTTFNFPPNQCTMQKSKSFRRSDSFSVSFKTGDLISDSRTSVPSNRRLTRLSSLKPIAAPSTSSGQLVTQRGGGSPRLVRNPSGLQNIRESTVATSGTKSTAASSSMAPSENPDTSNPFQNQSGSFYQQRSMGSSSPSNSSLIRCMSGSFRQNPGGSSSPPVILKRQPTLNSTSMSALRGGSQSPPRRLQPLSASLDRESEGAGGLLDHSAPLACSSQGPGGALPSPSSPVLPPVRSPTQPQLITPFGGSKLTLTQTQKCSGNSPESKHLEKPDRITNVVIFAQIPMLGESPTKGAARLAPLPSTE